MADYPESRRMPPAVDTPPRPVPPYSQTNTTMNAPARGTSSVVPAIAAVVIVALVGIVAWRVLDDGPPVTPATQTSAPATAPATEAAPVQTAPEPTPPAVPEGDPAPATPPVGDPPANPPATPPTASP